MGIRKTKILNTCNTIENVSLIFSINLISLSLWLAVHPVQNQWTIVFVHLLQWKPEISHCIYTVLEYKYKKIKTKNQPLKACSTFKEVKKPIFYHSCVCTPLPMVWTRCVCVYNIFCHICLFFFLVSQKQRAQTSLSGSYLQNWIFSCMLDCKLMLWF